MARRPRPDPNMVQKSSTFVPLAAAVAAAVFYLISPGTMLHRHTSIIKQIAPAFVKGAQLISRSRV